jgi:hypothetical protein
MSNIFASSEELSWSFAAENSKQVIRLKIDGSWPPIQKKNNPALKKGALPDTTSSE